MKKNLQDQDTSDTSSRASSRASSRCDGSYASSSAGSMKGHNDDSSSQGSMSQLFYDLGTEMSSLEYEDVSLRSDDSRHRSRGSRFQICRAAVWTVLAFTINTARIQYFGQPPSEADIIAKIYHVDTKQRVLIRGGRGTDGRSMRKGDYYYPKDQALLDLVTQNSVKPKMISRNATATKKTEALIPSISKASAETPVVTQAQLFNTSNATVVVPPPATRAASTTELN